MALLIISIIWYIKKSINKTKICRTIEGRTWCPAAGPNEDTKDYDPDVEDLDIEPRVNFKPFILKKK